MSNEEILRYNIPTAVPFVYEFDRHLNPLKFYYVLGEDLDEATIVKKEMDTAREGTASYTKIMELDKAQKELNDLIREKWDIYYVFL